MLKTIYIAGGKFTNLATFLLEQRGILEVQTGFINSLFRSPSYSQVTSEITHAVQGVKVVFNPTKVTINELVFNIFTTVVDPTSLNY